MRLHSQIVDGFLDDFDHWRAWLDSARYGDVVSEVDGVTYPGICAPLPGELQTEIRMKLQSLVPVERINWLFARLSVAGANPPHWAHHDASMGAWSMMLYMNRPEHCDGGTALLRHKEGGITAETWARDTNRPEQWHLESVCPMGPNRAFIFRAEQWHAAMPIGGFGSSASDGRLVITAFFE